ncbi:Ppx/GppA phosphatase family protein [Streptomyces melanogenes]|uniref:Ppx/GppA phosphatase family protein n=1 Tax=Streptomyces melanogenes TaxID=67326 RepID=UPI00167E0074|nr:Ppx/GppA family phosphatase [Streptomyces melanogenes]GGP86288.1 hypothetical protein GCM10010278_75840 [Streptomyces melanogenes]
MRLGVIDAGSNTVHLLIAQADGMMPLPLHTSKRRLRLAERRGPDGRLDEQAVADLACAVASARNEAAAWGVAEPFVLATAVIRDAPDCAGVLEAVRAASGVEVAVLSGPAEAELTYLAVRRWLGWSAGPLALLDVGGGSLEVAFGRTGVPDFAVSLPVGAARLTHAFLQGGDPPDPQALRALRRRVRHELRDAAVRMRWEEPRTAVATSRTFQQLARLCGAAPGRRGPFVHRTLDRSDLKPAIRELAALPARERAQLPGISEPRAEQSLAGAVVAHTAMKMLGIRTVTLCPWALREGILLRLIERGDQCPAPGLSPWFGFPAEREPNATRGAAEEPEENAETTD